MENLRVSQGAFSELFWKIIFQEAELKIKTSNAFFEDIDQLDILRKYADYNTGSISCASAWVMSTISNYFKPKLIAEVGTFIGRSTRALADFSDCVVHTCDFSNSIDIPMPRPNSIIQYKKKSSTEMLKSLFSEGLKPDMYHFDGRISDEDLLIIGELGVHDALILLDDFEGIEKGVINYLNLNKIKIAQSHFLVYPPAEILLNRYGYNGKSTTAVLIPKKMIKFVNQ